MTKKTKRKLVFALLILKIDCKMSSGSKVVTFNEVGESEARIHFKREIDRLLINNERERAAEKEVNVAPLEMTARELEAASHALIDEKNKRRVPSSDAQHAFYGMFPNKEFRYDVLQKEIASLPTDHARTSVGANRGRGTGVRTARLTGSSSTHTALHQAKSFEGMLSATVSAAASHTTSSVNHLVGTPPHHPTLLDKNYSLEELERAVLLHHKRALPCLPSAFYNLPVIFGDSSIEQLAEESVLDNKVFLVVFWRPSNRAGHLVVRHYEKLANDYPDLFTCVSIIVPKYADEKKYLNTYPGDLPKNLFLDQKGQVSADVLALSALSLGARGSRRGLATPTGSSATAGGMHDTHDATHRAHYWNGDTDPCPEPAVLMCLPADTGSNDAGAASLRPQFLVSESGLGGSTATLSTDAGIGSTTSGDQSYYNCHDMLFLVDGRRCISMVSANAVAALVNIYCASHRPGRYLQQEVHSIVTNPAWKQATWLSTSSVGTAGAALAATPRGGDAGRDSGSYYYSDIVSQQQISQGANASNMKALSLSERPASEASEEKGEVAAVALEAIPEAHYHVVKEMLGSCVTTGGGQKEDCITSTCNAVHKLIAVCAESKSTNPTYASSALHLERYLDIWRALGDSIAPVQSSSARSPDKSLGDAGLFLPFLYRHRTECERQGAAQEAGLSFGLLQHLQKNLMCTVETITCNSGSDAVEDFIAQKRRNSQRIHLLNAVSVDISVASVSAEGGLHMSMSSPSPEHTQRSTAAANSEPEWEKIYYYLRLGRYEDACAVTATFIEPSSSNTLVADLSRESTDADASLPNTTVFGSGGGSAAYDDHMSRTLGFQSKGRYERYQRREQQRRRSRGSNRSSSEGPEMLLRNVNTVLRALAEASSDVHATSSLGSTEVRNAVQGIWECLLRERQAVSDERKEQRYYEHAHRYDSENIGAGTAGSLGSDFSRRARSSSGSNASMLSPGESHVTATIRELEPHKECVLVLLSLGSQSLKLSETIPASEAEDPLTTNSNLLDIMRKVEGDELDLHDVLWAYLWAAYWGLAFHEADPDDTGTSECRDTYSGLTPRGFYAQVMDWGGGSHFDPALDNPYDYVLVLLCCQQYVAAVSHLRRSQQMIPAVHLACVCLYYGLISPADVIFDEIVDADAYTVDLVESGQTVSSMITHYALADIDPQISSAYLLMLLVPQCLSVHAEENALCLAPLNRYMHNFLGCLEALHLHLDSVGTMKDLLSQTMRQYIRDPAIMGALAVGLGQRLLTKHGRIEHAMQLYCFADELGGHGIGMGMYSQGLEALLVEMSVQLKGVLYPQNHHNRGLRANIRHATSSLLVQLLGPPTTGPLLHLPEGQPSASGLSRTSGRLFGLCSYLQNLETTARLLDSCADLDALCLQAGTIDVTKMLQERFLSLKWILDKPKDSTGVFVTALVLQSAVDVSEIVSLLHHQTPAVLELYRETLVHAASYLERLAHCVTDGTGGTYDILSQRTVLEDLKNRIMRTNAVVGSITAITDSIADHASRVNNWESHVALLDPMRVHSDAQMSIGTPKGDYSLSSSAAGNASNVEDDIERAQWSVYMAQQRDQEKERQEQEKEREREREQRVRNTPIPRAALSYPLERFGLVNTGNSCYISSIMVMIAHIKPLFEWLVQGTYAPVYKSSDRSASFAVSDDHSVTHRMAALLSYLSPQTEALSAIPSSLQQECHAFRRSVKLLNHRSFDNDDQQDAAEFFVWLTDRMLAEVSLGRSQVPPTAKIFGFDQQSRWMCAMCGRESFGSVEQQSQLYLNRDSSNTGSRVSTLLEWLRYTTRVEAGCQRRCSDSACNGTSASRQFMPRRQSLPEVLVMCLNRWGGATLETRIALQ